MWKIMFSFCVLLRVGLLVVCGGRIPSEYALMPAGFRFLAQGHSNSVSMSGILISAYFYWSHIRR